jgi:hypothetical protein
MTLKEIVKELELCNFECEAGPLRNHVAFQSLKEIAEKDCRNIGCICGTITIDTKDAEIAIDKLTQKLGALVELQKQVVY